jgi:hypothetical protein
MRKYLAGAVSFAVIAFMALSCSDFAMPERVHIKAKVAPQLGITEKTGDITGQFSKLIDEAFADSDQPMKVYDLQSEDPETDDGIKKFLIHLPNLFNYNINFGDYFNSDMGFSSEAVELKYDYDFLVPEMGNGGFTPTPGKKHLFPLSDPEKAIYLPLGTMGNAIKSVELNKITLEAYFDTFEDGIEISISCSAFGLLPGEWKKPEPVDDGSGRKYVIFESNGSAFDFEPNDHKDAQGNPAVEFIVKYIVTITVYEGELKPGEKMTVVDGRPELIVDWERAFIDLANQSTSTEFSGATPNFSLGEIKKDLQGINFEGINGYLYISSPSSLGSFKPKITLTAVRDGVSAQPDPADTQEIAILTEPLVLPDPDEKGDLVYKKSDYKKGMSPIDLSHMFNSALGNLSLEYKLKLDEACWINNPENTGVKEQRIRADLFIELPLKLGIQPGAEIDLGELMGFGKQDLLSSLNSDNSNTEINLYTLSLSLELDDELFSSGILVVENTKPPYNYYENPLNDKFIKIQMQNVASPFAPSIKIQFPQASTLAIPRKLHLMSVKFEAGVDATITF